MHRTSLLIPLSALLPASVFAIDLSSHDVSYPDVREGTPEAAAIAVLTNEGVVEGNPDGTFRPNRELNRAEFVKIVLESSDDHTVSNTDADNCFPDVKASDWFSKYVCYAKEHGILSGYPDGTFKPSNTVNYAEALKILTNVYGYDVTQGTGEKWYLAYYNAANDHGTALPMTIDFSSALARGKMARLTAAFMAEADGQLDEYRDFEMGNMANGSSSSSSSVSSSLSSQSSLSSTTPPVIHTKLDLPAAPSFMVVGSTTDPLANVEVKSANENAELRIAQIILFQEVTSLEELELVTDEGELIATLKRMTVSSRDDYKRVFEVQINNDIGFIFPVGETVPVIVRAKMRTYDNQGSSNQLFQVKQISLTTFGKSTGATVNNTFTGPFPSHQTAYGEIVKVRNAGATSAAMPVGTNQRLASFAFSGYSIPQASVRMTSLGFTVNAANGVSVNNWILTDDRGETLPCIVSSGNVECVSIPESMGTFSGTGEILMHLSGNVSLEPNAVNSTLSIELKNGGSPSSPGSLHWTDGVGNFRWVDSASPLAVGTRFTQ